MDRSESLCYWVIQVDAIVFVKEVCSCKNLKCTTWDLLLGLHGKKRYLLTFFGSLLILPYNFISLFYDVALMYSDIWCMHILFFFFSLVIFYPMLVLRVLLYRLWWLTKWMLFSFDLIWDYEQNIMLYVQIISTANLWNFTWPQSNQSL